jgi:SWI/SNF-related matrix-associated actin-dependent regulator 1 of chromatin subfamily A
MVRRLKRDVLTQLPEKLRSQLYIELPPKALKAATQGMARLKELGRLLAQAEEQTAGTNRLLFEQKTLISRLFRDNAVAKQSVCADLLCSTLEQVPTLVLFAKHMTMLDFLEEKVQSKGISYMRIDGSVSGEARDACVRRFQDGHSRVALLSIGAASTGITLTRASCMIFAELDWNPATLKQAEDRIHRIGQHSPCDIRYVVATGTIDEVIFRKITAKNEISAQILGD